MNMAVMVDPTDLTSVSPDNIIRPALEDLLAEFLEEFKKLM